MYKLVKLTRLLRILKVLKAKNKLLKYANDWLKISAGFERLFIFAVGFLMMCHIGSCLWVMIAQFYGDNSSTWLSEFGDYTTKEMYIVSIYFIITTITTVGYGDISISNTMERIFCAFIMIIGVVAFSFA